MDLFKLKGSVELNSKEVIKGLDDIDRKAKTTDKSIGNISTASAKTTAAMSKMKKMGQGAMATIDKWARRGAIAVGGLATAFIGMGINSNASLETSITSWTTLLGTQEDAKKMMDDITNYAAKTPFSKMGVDAMAKQLSNAGYAGDDLFAQLTKFGNMGSAFGVQEDSLKEMVRQYSQVQMAQVAYTEDLNILQDRGIPIYKALSETLGVTVADVKKMASEGEISAEIYNAAIDSIASNTEGAMEAQSKTFSGMLSTLKDNITNISQQVLEPLFEKLLEVMPKILEVTDAFTVNLNTGKGVLDSIKEAIIQVFGEETYNKITSVMEVVKNLTIAYIALKIAMGLATLINTLVTVFTALRGVMLLIKGSTVAQTIAQWALNSAFLACPVTWVVAAILAIIGIFILLWNKCDGFREFWINLWETIKSACGVAKDWIIEKVTGMVTGAIEKFNNFRQGVTDIFNGIKDFLGGIVDKIKGIFDFEWKLPKIPMPHFNVSGKFSLNPPSIPKFGVDWYSKGAIFTQPTILPGGIGVGDANNGKGSKAEAILPIDDLRDMIKDLLQVAVSLNIDGRDFTRQVVAPHQDELNNYALGR